MGVDAAPAHAAARSPPRPRRLLRARAGAVPLLHGKGLLSSTFQLNLGRVGHNSPYPLSDRLGENHAPNVSHKICLR